MKDFGWHERMMFLRPARSRGIWLFVVAAVFVSLEWWLRPLWH